MQLFSLDSWALLQRREKFTLIFSKWLPSRLVIFPVGKRPPFLGRFWQKVRFVNCTENLPPPPPPSLSTPQIFSRITGEGRQVSEVSDKHPKASRGECGSGQLRSSSHLERTCHRSPHSTNLTTFNIVPTGKVLDTPDGHHCQCLLLYVVRMPRVLETFPPFWARMSFLGGGGRLLIVGLHFFCDQGWVDLEFS